MTEPYVYDPTKITALDLANMRLESVRIAKQIAQPDGVIEKAAEILDFILGVKDPDEVEDAPEQEPVDLDFSGTALNPKVKPVPFTGFSWIEPEYPVPFTGFSWIEPESICYVDGAEAGYSFGTQTFPDPAQPTESLDYAAAVTRIALERDALDALDKAKQAVAYADEANNALQAFLKQEGFAERADAEQQKLDQIAIERKRAEEWAGRLAAGTVYDRANDRIHVVFDGDIEAAAHVEGFAVEHFFVE